MAIFNLQHSSSIREQDLLHFARRFGLNHLQHNEGADKLGISHITVQKEWHKTYIPYTNKPINWHTDGYYNKPNEQINGMILYCQNPAPKGGENALLDHDLAYLYLREKGEQYIHALSDSKAMMIPANDVADHIQRPDCYGSVFSVKQDGRLHMRYSARKRNIVWQDDPITTDAVQLLNDFMIDTKNPHILKATLQAGQGLICNNVLHNRATFTDAPDNQRLLYRLRYFDAINC